MRLLPMLWLVLANALWGSSYVVAKVALEEIPAPLLASLRFTLAALALWFILLTRGQRARFPSPADARRLVALGALGVGVNGLLSYWGVSLTTATDAALLIVGEVVFTTLLAVLLTAERLSLLRVASLGAGILGALVLILGGVAAQPSAEAPARAVGNLLILTGLAFESAFTVLGTRLTQRYDPLTVLTISISGSCVLWLPTIAFYVVHEGLPAPSVASVGGVLYLAFVNSVACYLVWFSVVRSAGAALGALSLLAQPVVGAALGIVLLGDPLTPATLVGAVCVIACLLLASPRAPQTAVET
jgi:drug/metabolite transporter (DMT)-like permease